MSMHPCTLFTSSCNLRTLLLPQPLSRLPLLLLPLPAEQLLRLQCLGALYIRVLLAEKGQALPVWREGGRKGVGEGQYVWTICVDNMWGGREGAVRAAVWKGTVRYIEAQTEC